MKRPKPRSDNGPIVPPSTFYTRAVIIFVAALTVRLVHVWQMRGTLFFSVLMGDARGYDTWARQLAAGDWIGRDVFYQAPLYPYFLGLIYAVVGHDLLAVRVIQAIVGAISSVLLGYAGWQLLSPSAGLIAGLMLALYPPAIFFDGLLQKSVLDVFFVCLSLALVSRILARGATRSLWLALGVTLGALSLTRENALVLAAVVIAWAYSDRAWRARTDACGKNGRRAPGRFDILAATSVALGLAIVLVPVAVRNHSVGGGFYLTTSQFGSNLYIGNNPKADGSYID